ncbi:homeobox protein engrailed-1 [Iris pallida]|uniref:Homeobox protein engrailed-1 n=1 Tax=Iris pallida TaxID=29817 RepID=A0AAX6GQA8_IRIPA|nr:homeobox protein engrailed-1 [Iris pallida]
MSKVWVKSLKCKSSALEDVYNPKPSPTSCKKPILPLSCGNSSQAFRDVVFLLPKLPAPQPETRPAEDSSITKKKRSKSKKPKPKPATIGSSPSPSPSTGPTASIPTLTELPEGHSSRRIVEIIFGSSWSTSPSAPARFPGRIEMLFRVHNPPRTVSRFDDYRSAVRSLADSDSRCAVDGNEMMRFHCPPGGGDGIYDASVVFSPVCSPGSGRAAGIRTFAGSGGAHESAGGGSGRRSVLVCRVIAGRVREGTDSEGESVSGPGKGELIVFDARAVLPCFLIIYKV